LWYTQRKIPFGDEEQTKNRVVFLVITADEDDMNIATAKKLLLSMLKKKKLRLSMLKKRKY